jgi:hypothetical protein
MHIENKIKNKNRSPGPESSRRPSDQLKTTFTVRRSKPTELPGVMQNCTKFGLLFLSMHNLHSRTLSQHQARTRVARYGLRSRLEL